MLAHHRNFVYKRSPNDNVHLGLAARAKLPAVDQGASTLNTPTPPIPTTPDPTSSDQSGDNPTPSIGPAKQTPSSTTPPSVTTPTSPTPAAPSSSPSSPPSHASPSSSASDSVSASSSATAATTPSAVSIPSSVAAATSGFVAPTVATQVATGVSLTLATPSLSSSPTSSAGSGSSGGTNTGAIVGAIAGTLAGIAVFGFLLRWCMRRQRDQDVDDFDAQAFRRQSAVLVDDPVEPSRPYNPRPPTMIERHNASPALAAQGGFGGQNFYGSYSAYNQQPSYGPPETIQPAGSPPPQAYGAQSLGYGSYDAQQPIGRHPSNAGHVTFDDQQHLARQPSNPAYLTRQPSAAAGYAPPVVPPASHEPNTQYIDLNRSSVSPYQAAQYADISRQLGTTNPNSQVPHESLELPDDPLPSPFDDPVEVNASAHHHPTNATASGVPATAASAPRTQQNVADQRPTTVYQEGDAYGGI